MEKEYDFSKGKRGRFYRPDARFHLPVYLDPDVERFMAEFAAKRRSSINELVNSLLKKQMESMELEG